MSQRQFTIPKALAQYLGAVEDGEDGCLLMITMKPGTDVFTANLIVTHPADDDRENGLQPMADSIRELFEGNDTDAHASVSTSLVHPASKRIH